MNVRAFTYARYHGKSNIGSTRLRVQQLYKYWPDYKDYTYGENPDVIVFQKVYIQPDWEFPAHFQGIKILDICDPDWMEQQDVKRTVDAMDGVVVPTQALADFIAQLTDKPIKVIPDRHDVLNISLPRKHEGKITSAVWFGYQQNAELLKYVIPTLEKRGISLTVLSNDNPYADRWALDPQTFEYHFAKFNEETIIEDLKLYDIALLPQGSRPRDRFKSNNKTTLAWLAGLPVVTDLESLDAMETAEARDKEGKKCYDKAKELYDVRLSVQEMKGFISELKASR